MNVAYPIMNAEWLKASETNRSLPNDKKSWGRATVSDRRVPVSRVGDEFADYEMYGHPDWDGYGGSPITMDTVNCARAFKLLLPRDVPLPDIAPGADGTIGFEWRFGPASARTLKLVDVGPGNIITAREIRADGTVDVLPPTRLGEGDRALVHRLFS